MSCIKFLYQLCSKSCKKKKNNIDHANKSIYNERDLHYLLKIVQNQSIDSSQNSSQKYKTIRKRHNSFPTHPSCGFIFKNNQYENSEISLFANRAIKHHNNTKNRKK